MSKKMHRSSIITAGFTVLLLSFIIIRFSLPAVSDGVVNFHADVTSGNAPLTVQFTSDYTGIKYQWSFGDGGSTAKNPSHTYNNPGTYDVSLTITNGSGGTIGTEVKTGYIVVSPQKPSTPTADFTASPTSGTAPLSVKFKGFSSGGTLSFDWDFGDGTQHSAEMNPTHNYVTAGNYTVKLKVSNPGGSNTKSAQIVVTAPAVQNNNGNNNASTAAGALAASITVTPIPLSTIAAIAPQSNGGLLTFSVSEDMIQIILTALIAIVIAFMVIYYFSSLSKREEKKHVKTAPAGRNMLKSRMPVIGQNATDGVAPKPETVKPPETAKLPEMPMMPVEAIRQQDVVSAPETVKPHVVVKAPEAVKVPEPVKPHVVVKAPEAVKVPEPVKSPARPVSMPPEAAKLPPTPAKETARPPVEKPVAQPPDPLKRPMKFTDLLKSKAKEETKTPPPAAKPAKPSRRRNDVDKDYLYGLVMGENEEQDDKNKK